MPKANSSMLVAVATILLVTSAIAIYKVVDTSVTVDHQNSALRQALKERDLLAALLRDLQGLSTRADIEARVSELYATNHVISRDTPDSIGIDEIVLTFANNRLSKVSSLASP